MRTFGWICISLGLTILVVGVPLVIINVPILAGKVILAALVNIFGGWIMIARNPISGHCSCGIKVDKSKNFCGWCGVQLKR